MSKWLKSKSLISSRLRSTSYVMSIQNWNKLVAFSSSKRKRSTKSKRSSKISRRQWKHIKTSRTRSVLRCSRKSTIRRNRLEIKRIRLLRRTRSSKNCKKIIKENWRFLTRNTRKKLIARESLINSLSQCVLLCKILKSPSLKNCKIWRSVSLMLKLKQLSMKLKLRLSLHNWES